MGGFALLVAILMYFALIPQQNLVYAQINIHTPNTSLTIDKNTGVAIDAPGSSLRVDKQGIRIQTPGGSINITVPLPFSQPYILKGKKILFVPKEGKITARIVNKDGTIFMENVPLKDITNYLDEAGYRVAYRKNVLSMRTKDGTEELTTLPLGIEIGTSKRFIQLKNGKEIPLTLSASNAADLLHKKGVITKSSKKITIEENNGRGVYTVQGRKQYTIFTFYPVVTDIKAFVSIEKGEIIEVKQPTYTPLLQLLSPSDHIVN